MKLHDKPTSFLNVQVTVSVDKDQAGKTHYKTSFTPERLVVTEYDTVINYQIVDPTPAGIRFKSMTVKPAGENQLSDPSISESGKLLTFSNANTKKVDFHLTLHFKGDAEVQFAVDPEMSNEPPPSFVARATLLPEMGNEPTPS